MATTSKDRLRDASKDLFETLGERTLSAAGDKVSDLTDRLESMAENGGLSLPKLALPQMAKSGAKGLVDKAKSALPSSGSDDDSDDDSGSGGGGSETKVTTIIEEIDVGLPVSLVYDQWTEFGSFPSFMKKVETVDTVEDQRIKWKAQIWWSHREWESTILEQLPDERIVWKSTGKKGYVDGVVTFHDLTPDLTRIIVVLEYHPQGLFERTANIWRAQGRRVRAELQHFRRHIMAHTVLDPDSVHGWRGVIEDGEVVESPEEHEASEDEYDGEEPEDEYDEEPEDLDDEPEDEEPDEEPEDEYDDEYDDEEPDEEPEDEYDDEEPEDEEYEDDEEDRR